MEVKEINDSVGLEGLVPTFLVFGALPRLELPTDKAKPSIFQRAVALRKETEEMKKNFVSRQVKAAVHERNGPDVTDIHTTPIGSPVLVYRPEKDLWEGPFSVLDISGEDVKVLLPHGTSNFRSTVVKPYHFQGDSDNTDLNDAQERRNQTDTEVSVHFTFTTRDNYNGGTPDSFMMTAAQAKTDTTRF